MHPDDNGKWQVGFWIISVLVVASFTWTTTCALINRGSIESLLQKFNDLRVVSNDVLHEMDKKLIRIEGKLDNHMGGK